MMQRLPIRKVVLNVLSVFLIVSVVWASYKSITADVFSGDDWRNFVIDGLAQGSLYALIALGYTLVYGILLMINFAHGEVFMAGAFTSFFFARSMAESGFLNDAPYLSLPILLIISMLTSTIIAVLLERIAYRPLRNAPRLVPLITAIGASLFLQYTFAGLYGSRVRAYPGFDFLQGSFSIFGMDLSKRQLVVIVSALVLMYALYWFVNKTKTGRAMRAVGEDKEIAGLMGIDVDRIIVLTFAIGGMLAGAAGILFAIKFQSGIQFTMGFFPGIKAFTAAVLGGIGNIVGAGIGGILLGVIESLAPALLLTGPGVDAPFQLKDVIAFSVLVFVLIFKPGGILGSDEAEKV
jgi:branched-chain amino acid transport system permease protein